MMIPKEVMSSLKEDTKRFLEKYDEKSLEQMGRVLFSEGLTLEGLRAAVPPDVLRLCATLMNPIGRAMILHNDDKELRDVATQALLRLDKYFAGIQENPVFLELVAEISAANTEEAPRTNAMISRAFRSILKVRPFHFILWRKEGRGLPASRLLLYGEDEQLLLDSTNTLPGLVHIARILVGIAKDSLRAASSFGPQAMELSADEEARVEKLVAGLGTDANRLKELLAAIRQARASK